MTTNVSTNIIVKDTIYLDGGCSIHTESISGQSVKKLVLHTHSSSGNKIQKDVSDIGSGGGGSITWTNNRLADSSTSKTIIQQATTPNLNFLSWDNAQSLYKTIDIKTSGAMNPAISNEVCTSTAIEFYLVTNYASIGHNHGNMYALSVHNHDSSYAPKPVSGGLYKWSGTTWQTAQDSDIPGLSTKAPLASPTFTGTVGGINKSMVGLSNVDNTSDLNKPISNLTQTALDNKAPNPSSANIQKWEISTTNPTGAWVDAQLKDCVDVNINGISNGQFLKWNGSGWGPGSSSAGGATEMTGLNDVEYDSSLPIDVDQILMTKTKQNADGTTSLIYENKEFKINTLTDVNISASPTAGLPLKINSGGDGVDSGKIDLETAITTTLGSGYLYWDDSGVGTFSSATPPSGASNLHELTDVNYNTNSPTTPVDPNTVIDGDLLYYNGGATHGYWMPLTLDTTPTSDSTKPATSGGIYTAVNDKADKNLSNSTITGTVGEPLKIKNGGTGLESGKIDLETGVDTQLADGYLKVFNNGFAVETSLSLDHLDDVNINNSDDITKGIFYNVNEGKYEDVIMGSSILPLLGIDIDQTNSGISYLLDNIGGDLTITLNASEHFLEAPIKHSYIYIKIETAIAKVDNIIIVNADKIQNGGQIMIEVIQIGGSESTSTLGGVYETDTSGSNLRMKSKTMPSDFKINVDEVLLITLYKTCYGGTSTNKYYVNADVYES